MLPIVITNRSVMKFWGWYRRSRRSFFPTNGLRYSNMIQFLNNIKNEQNDIIQSWVPNGTGLNDIPMNGIWYHPGLNGIPCYTIGWYRIPFDTILIPFDTLPLNSFRFRCTIIPQVSPKEISLIKGWKNNYLMNFIETLIWQSSI